MRLSEWLFPIRRYIRLGRNVSTLRAVLTAAIACAVQWFSTHVFLEVGSSGHISLARKILRGLEGATEVFRTDWQADWHVGEEFILVSIFAGSILGVALIELIWAGLLLRRGMPGRDTRAGGDLIRFVLLGTQSWAVFWLLFTIWFTFIAHTGGVVLFWVTMLLPAAAVIIATTLQAAEATRTVCMASPAADGPSDGASEMTRLPWQRHLLILLAGSALVAAILGASVLVFRPRTPPLSWSPADRVNALLAEANTPKSWIERTLNIFPYRREQDEIRGDLVAIGPQAVDPLIAAWRDPDLKGGLFPGAARCYAANALGQLGDKRAVDPLIEALNAPEPMVRASAAWALGQLGDERAIIALERALEDTDRFGRMSISSALSMLRNQLGRKK